MDLASDLAETRTRVDTRLDLLLQGGPPALLEAMRYSVLGGGKRLRPILCLWTHDMLRGSNSKAVLDLACCFEFVHTYSLIHDDLPCMDDDDLRRGRPTCHVRFGEALAVLAGDALLNLAYATLVRAGWSSTRQALDLVCTLTDAASHEGLLGGQVLDLEAEGQTPTRAGLHAIHNAKTASLIRAALVCGGQAAQASSDELLRLARAGRHLGLAFQITDDVLDVVGEAATLGKSPGKDASARKMTYPALVGLEASRHEARVQIEAADEILAAWPQSTRLRTLARFFVERTS